jgi:phospholipid-binding lipoprotein MlaA
VLCFCSRRTDLCSNQREDGFGQDNQMHRLVRTLWAALLFAAFGCAAIPQDPEARLAYDEANDPLEPLNRQIFNVNQVVDKALFKPAAEAYRAVVPETLRTALRNMLNNLGEPVIIANNVMQGEFRRAAFSLDRLIFNSTVGVGGIMDFAGEHGLPRESGDFGQTLYSWGVPDGPYLILPILGPSNPRDAIGMTADSFMDPFRYVLTGVDPDATFLDDPNVARSMVDGIDERSRAIDELDAVEKSAIDFYAQIRSLSRQNRAKDLRHGKAAPPASPASDLDENPATGQEN